MTQAHIWSALSVNPSFSPLFGKWRPITLPFSPAFRSKSPLLWMATLRFPIISSAEAYSERCWTKHRTFSLCERTFRRRKSSDWEYWGLRVLPVRGKCCRGWARLNAEANCRAIEDHCCAASAWCRSHSCTRKDVSIGGSKLLQQRWVLGRQRLWLSEGAVRVLKVD